MISRCQVCQRWDVRIAQAEREVQRIARILSHPRNRDGGKKITTETLDEAKNWLVAYRGNLAEHIKDAHH